MKNKSNFGKCTSILLSLMIIIGFCYDFISYAEEKDDFENSTNNALVTSTVDNGNIVTENTDGIQNIEDEYNECNNIDDLNRILLFENNYWESGSYDSNGGKISRSPFVRIKEKISLNNIKLNLNNNNNEENDDITFRVNIGRNDVICQIQWMKNNNSTNDNNNNNDNNNTNKNNDEEIACDKLHDGAVVTLNMDADYMLVTLYQVSENEGINWNTRYNFYEENFRSNALNLSVQEVESKEVSSLIGWDFSRCGNWNMGSFYMSNTIKLSKGHIALNKFLTVESKTEYRLNVNGNILEVPIEIAEFASDGTYIRKDTLKSNGDFFITDQNTSYVGIGFYKDFSSSWKYMTNSLILSDISFTKISNDNEVFVTEDINIDNVNSKLAYLNNWESGSYDSNANKISRSPFLRISGPVKFQTVNDSNDSTDKKLYRMNIGRDDVICQIQWMNSSNVEIACDKLHDGAVFSLKNDAKYALITLYQVYENEGINWSTRYNFYSESFEDESLKINIEDLGLESDNQIYNLDTWDFSRYGNWCMGSYYKSSDIKLSKGHIALESKLYAEPNKEYKLNVDSENKLEAKLEICEFTKDGTYIKTDVLGNDSDTFITDQNTYKVGIGYYKDFSSSWKYMTSSLISSNISFEKVENEKLEDIDNIDVLLSLNINNRLNDDSSLNETYLKLYDGKFNKDNEFVQDDNYKRIDKLFKISKEDASGLKLISNSSNNSGNNNENNNENSNDNNVNLNVRLNVIELDSNKKFIKEFDIGVGEILPILDNTSYITTSMYKQIDYSISSLSEEDIKNIDIDFTIFNDYSDIDSEFKPEFIGEFGQGSLINYANFQAGALIAWQGGYRSTTSLEAGNMVIRNYYKVEPNNTYYFNSNDSRFKIRIVQRDKDGKFISWSDLLSDGESFITEDNCSYLNIQIRSTQWGLSIKNMMNGGLKLSIAKSHTTQITIHSIFENTDLSNFSNWSSGSFVSSTKAYVLSDNDICINSFLDIESSNGKTFMITLPNAYSSLNIMQMDKDNNLIEQNNGLRSGNKWTCNNNTSYITITLTNSKKLNYESWENLFGKKEKSVIIEEFIRYNHNTVMNNEYTSYDWTNQITQGWNLGNSLASHYGDWNGEVSLTQETIWGQPYVTEDLIKEVKEKGFNTVRIPVTWYYHTWKDEEGHLHIHDEWLQRVQDVVDYCLKQDMSVMINTMDDHEIFYCGTDDESFNQVKIDAADIWRDIAEYFKDYDERLVFESYNEIDNVALSWQYQDKASNQMDTLNQIFVDTVRSTGGNNSYRVLCVQSLIAAWEPQFINGFNLPTDSVDNKLMIQVHPYVDVFDQDLEYMLNELDRFSNKNNCPIIIGEFGLVKSSYQPALLRNAATSNYVARANAHNIKTFYWDEGNLSRFGIIDRRDDENTDNDLIDAIINSKKYVTLDNKFVYDDLQDFLFKGLNSDGSLSDAGFWGSLVLGDEEKGIEIPEGKDYLMALISTSGIHDAGDEKIHKIYFYDENMNLIDSNKYSQNYGEWDKWINIPEGAKYVRLMIYSATHKTEYYKFSSYFINNELRVSLTFLNKDNVLNEVVPEEDGIIAKEYNNSYDEFIINKESINLSDSYSLLSNIDNWYFGKYEGNYIEEIESSENNSLINKYIFIPEANSSYTINCDELNIYIQEYDKNGILIRSKAYYDNATFTPEYSTEYVTIMYFKQYNSNAFTGDNLIKKLNLSNISINKIDE